MAKVGAEDRQEKNKIILTEMKTSSRLCTDHSSHQTTTICPDRVGDNFPSRSRVQQTNAPRILKAAAGVIHSVILWGCRANNGTYPTEDFSRNLWWRSICKDQCTLCT